MEVNIQLPYNKYLVPDLVTGTLIRMALAEDWSAQRLFHVVDKRGYMSDDEVPRMRRYLHTLRVLETEIRMRNKARGYHGL